ncbi:glycerophosphoryl diester phosphodiesterase [Moniliophthora roreri MCA 2997]|uniref:Glycerophosphoryl diester phosphodiesterase n=1 Tax=Moniliophthora roreri (strain MCA 2997) TaxID=1381753 RepID=V2XX17_MONRO|nr:glycerophosphoryl diester phosphodiesterase [Moniliophthora roreri MCA 2997]
MVPSILGILALGAGALAVPLQSDRVARGNQEAFDIQGHRGGRGETVESTLPSFAWGLINGVKTLELDNGITKDGVVVVWHDENIVPEKCRDTVPAFENDPDFPYVGKFIVNLTLAQVKTLDCGSERLLDFPLQTTYPKTPISTLEELFAFVDCVDPKHTVAFNIESKVNAIQTNQTRGPQDFVRLQHEQFVKSPFYKTITFQSFDWRSLVGMKALDPSIPTAALGSM